MAIASGRTTIVQECDAHILARALTVLKSDHPGPFLWLEKALRLPEQVRGAFFHSRWQEDDFIPVVEKLLFSAAICLGFGLLRVIWSVNHIIASLLSIEEHISDGLFMAIERFRTPEANMMASSFLHSIGYLLLRFSDLSFTLILRIGFSIFVLLG